jgi:imidazolonepropionase-like amidohydrolase
MNSLALRVLTKKRLLLCFLLFSSPLYAQTRAIRAGNLIDPATGTVAKNQIILIQDGKIQSVGASVQIPAGAEVIDLSSAWVMPGLMDAHVHLTYGAAPGPFNLIADYLRDGSGLRALRGAKNARETLEAGFTAVKDIGNDANYAAVDLRRAIERGWTPGPTMLTTGKIIAAFGGQSRGVPPEIGPYWHFEYIDADTPDEIRKAVRQNIYYGANAIKLVADNNAYFYSEAEIRAAVEEGHAAGVTVVVHVIGGQAARNVILGGADSIEHGFALDDELLELMKQKGTVLVGTDFPEAHFKLMQYGADGGTKLATQIIDRLRRAHRIGVKLAFGTDVVVEPPGKTRGEMALDYLDVWTAAGVPPKDILRAMTTNVAELFRWQGQRGAIAAGQAADIIATPQNPLENIQALRKVQFVMKDGRVVKKP